MCHIWRGGQLQGQTTILACPGLWVLLEDKDACIQMHKPGEASVQEKWKKSPHSAALLCARGSHGPERMPPTKSNDGKVRAETHTIFFLCCFKDFLLNLKDKVTEKEGKREIFYPLVH